MLSGNRQFSSQVSRQSQLGLLANTSQIHQQLSWHSKQQRWHVLADTAMPQPNRHKSAGGVWTSRDVRTSSQLYFSQRSEGQRRFKTNKCCTASSRSKPSPASITVHQFLFIFSLNTTCPPWFLHYYMSSLSGYHLANQPQSEKTARNYSTPPEVFLCVSLDGVLANGAQLHNVRQNNICVSLVKNL